MLVHYGEIIINAPLLSQIVKLQNEAVRIINVFFDGINNSILTVSLNLLKFLDIVKLNTLYQLFYNYFHHEKFPNIPAVSIVSELHNYNTRSTSSNQIVIPPFRTYLRRFCPSVIGIFF